MKKVIDGLHPNLQTLARKLKDECKKQGIDALVYCGYRSIDEQNKLYAQGRTAPGQIVTNAKGGSSYHNFKVAFDCGPVIGKSIAWNREDLFRKIGAIGKRLGLEWGGDFKSIKDLPHFQYRQGLTLADFRAGKTLK